jgi:hypothetical protein
LRRAACKSLYRVLGAIAGKRGRLGADRDLLAKLVARHVCNSHGSRVIGQLIAPMVAAAIEREGYARVATQEKPVLVSLKGASAAGKSSLRPMLKQLLREQGMAADGYATISPDVWRRLLLDYETLGPARKYAGHLTSRELMVIDGKLDRHIRDQAELASAPFPTCWSTVSASTASPPRRSDGCCTTPMPATWTRCTCTSSSRPRRRPSSAAGGGHWSAAATRRWRTSWRTASRPSRGMPKILFKWLASPRPDYRYVFLDNRVPKGTASRGPSPAAIAAAWSSYDPLALVDVERYQKINIHASSPLPRCIRRRRTWRWRRIAASSRRMRAAHPAHRRTGRCPASGTCLLCGSAAGSVEILLMPTCWRGRHRTMQNVAAALAGMAPPVGALCEKWRRRYGGICLP